MEIFHLPFFYFSRENRYSDTQIAKDRICLKLEFQVKINENNKPLGRKGIFI